MKLLVLTMLLAVAQATPLGTWLVMGPVAVWPFEFNATTQQNQADAQTAEKKTKSSPVAIMERPKPKEGHPHADDIATETQPKAVRVTELPPNDTWYKAYVIATIVMALVTIGLAIIGFRGVHTANKTLEKVASQLATMQRQTGILAASVKVAKDAAKAARDSADAMINSERAWILVEVQSANGGTLCQPTETTPEMGDPETTVEVKLIFKNEGKSPAWITEYVVSLQIVNSFAEEPIYEYHWNTIASLGPNPVAVGQESVLNRTISCNGHLDKKSSVDNELKFLVIYGIFKYRDPFSDARYTRLGYWITENHLVRIPYLGKESYQWNDCS